MSFGDASPASSPGASSMGDGVYASAPNEIRVLIIDDNFVVRRGLQSSLEFDPAIQIVGEGSSGDEAIELARDLVPDVILMDIRMPDRDGIAATEVISDESPASKVLILTWSEDPEHLRSAVLAGAKGYLVHGRFSPERLSEAVHVIHEGGALITPMLAPALLEFVRAGAQGGRSRSASGSVLTPRELQVLQLLAEGLPNRGIAQALGISEHTVKYHVNAILGKLGAQSRTEAVVRATRLGLIVL